MDKVEMQTRFLRTLVRPNQKIAIRGLRNNNNGTYERVFGDMSKAVDYANGLEAGGSCKGVYFTINPLKDDYNGTYAKDADIKARHVLFIDIDANRNPEPPLEGHKVSSNEQELNATIEMANEVVAYLRDNGITQEPIIAISGNGTHLYYSIEMPNDDESLDTLKYFLKHLGDKINGVKGDIDTTIRNAARIAKLTGTMATKGVDGVEEGRNHRMARVIAWPSKDALAWQLDTVESEKIKMLAEVARESEVVGKRQAAADRKAKSRGGRTTNYQPRNEVKKDKKESKQMTTFINRIEFLLNHSNIWINAAYEQIDSPDDRNQWLGILTSVKTIQGERGFDAFDVWCSTSAHYDANGNRQAWDMPASDEGVENETLKLAYTMMKLGVNFDEIAEANGYELSRDEVMSIDEIKAQIAADNSLTVKWAYSPRKGDFVPVGVWSKDVSKRRLETMNDATRAQSMLSMFISTEESNGFLNPILPFIMGGTDDLYVFDEVYAVWTKIEKSKVIKQIQSLNGFTVVGKKDGQIKTLSSKDANHDLRQMFSAIEEMIPNCTKQLAFNNTALFFDGKSVSYRKAKASDMFTHKMDMDYAGATATPEFDAILNRLFDGDAERVECYLQWAGAAIMGATTSLQLPMMLLVSEVGGTGKSMLLKLLEQIITPAKVSPVQLANLKDRGILINIAPKSLIVDFDVNLDCILDNVDVLKNLITGEGMDQRVVGGKQSINVRYRGAVAGAANGMPSFKRYDSGLDRRILIVPTTNKAISKTEVVREYETILFQKEGAGIVHKMVEAFKRMLVAGELVIPQVCQEAKETFRNEVDVVSTWFAESYEFHPEAKLVHVKDVYNSYKAWCSLNGHQATSATRFTKDLKSKAMIAGDGYFAQMRGYPAIRIEMKARQIGFSN